MLKDKWVGLKNYDRLLSDKIFLKAVWNSVKYMIGTCALLIPFPLLFASLLNSKLMKKPGLFKSIYFLPALTSVVVAGTFPPDLRGNGYSIGKPRYRIFRTFPDQMAERPVDRIFCAASGSLLEMDRCKYSLFPCGLTEYFHGFIRGSFHRWCVQMAAVQKISFPLVKPTTVYVLTISIYAGLSMFLESYMLWKGNNSPQNIGLTIVGYLYRQGIEKRAMGYACAVGLVLLIVVMIVNLIQLTVTGTFKKEER